MILLRRNVPIAQWIERSPAEADMEVRLSLGTQLYETRNSNSKYSPSRSSLFKKIEENED